MIKRFNGVNCRQKLQSQNQAFHMSEVDAALDFLRQNVIQSKTYIKYYIQAMLNVTI